MGDQKLPFGASLSDAIDAAGGYRIDNSFEPTGLISVRSSRKRDGKYYCRRRILFRKSDLKQIKLKDKDFVVVQYLPKEKIKRSNHAVQPTAARVTLPAGSLRSLGRKRATGSCG